jgi:hypothetical protein
MKQQLVIAKENRIQKGMKGKEFGSSKSAA